MTLVRTATAAGIYFSLFMESIMKRTFTTIDHVAAILGTIVLVASFAQSANAGKFDRDLLDLHNAWRANNNLPPMVSHPELQAAAEDFARQRDRTLSPKQHGYTGQYHFSSVGGTARLTAEYVWWYFLNYDTADEWYARQIRNPDHKHFGAAVGRFRHNGEWYSFAIVVYGHGE